MFCSLNLTIDFQGAEKCQIYCPQCSAKLTLSNSQFKRKKPSPPASKPETTEEDKIKATVESLEKVFNKEDSYLIYRPISYYVQRDFNLPKADKLISKLAVKARNIYRQHYGKYPMKDKTYLYTDSEWSEIKPMVLQRFKEIDPEGYSYLKELERKRNSLIDISETANKFPTQLNREVVEEDDDDDYGPMPF